MRQTDGSFHCLVQRSPDGWPHDEAEAEERLQDGEHGANAVGELKGDDGERGGQETEKTRFPE